MKTKTLIGSALVFFGLPSCGAVLHEPLLAPEKGGAPWTEVSTEHFVLKTDLSKDAAQQMSENLEEIFAALADVGFEAAGPNLQIDVVHFRYPADYAELASKMSAGSFFSDGRHDFENRPLALSGGDFVQQTRELLQHELTHLFVHYYYPQAPVWLNEGLARYMETMSIESGAVVFGRTSRRSRFWKGPRKWTYDPSGDTLLLPLSEAPSLADLRHMSSAEFYGDRALDPRTSEGARAAEVTAIHYEGAWALVHLLLTSETYGPGFREYLGRLHAGDTHDAAWAKSLNDVSDEQLEKDYRASLMPKEVMLKRAKWETPAYEAKSIHEMTSSEVHILWARIRPDTPEEERAAEEDLAEARKLQSRDGDEADADWALVRAYRMAQGKQITDAETVLRDALASRPGDARLWNALGRLTFRATVDEAGRVSPAGQQALVTIAEHLEPIAKSASQLDLLANIAGVSSRADAALAYEKRAVAADPNCLSCLAEAAHIVYAKGRVREALDIATLALGLLSEGRHMPRLVELADTCRRQLAEPSAHKQ